MGKFVVRYRDGLAAQWGLLHGTAPASPEDQVVVSPLSLRATTVADVIAAFDAGTFETGQSKTLTGRDLLSPITTDAVIYCQGLNYADHAAEADHHSRKTNLVFNKASSALMGPFNDIIRPDDVELLDYEVELGLVLRREISQAVQVDSNNVGDYVAGVVLANDVSARDTMFSATFFQWFEGKSARTFCPCGPVLWLLTPNEVEETLGNLEISLSLNGEPRQRASTSQLIWKPAETIAHLSRRFDLKAGDLILSGAPGGVTAAVTAKLVQIFRDLLFDDAGRRAALRAELKNGRPFMQPGGVVTTSLRALRSNEFLGGMLNVIVE